mmetsp:Transcript_14677/g.40549  ORF Transcript_14677/g.40549 Transcript_14677/m.40549 type:complete len:242 (+) Transcript_14677:554-1279(+)
MPQSTSIVPTSSNSSTASTSLTLQKSLMNQPQEFSKVTQKLLTRPSTYGVEGNEIGNLAQDAGYLWRELPVPVIGVLHGICFGGGLQIALGADMRYAAEDCQFSIMEGKYGLIPDMGITVALREVMNIDQAKELTYTGRIVTGEEATQMGLITRVCEDPMKEAEAVAKVIAGRSPDAMACAKHLYQSTWRTGMEEKDCLEMESEMQHKLLISWNQVAASSRSFGWKVPYTKRKDGSFPKAA